MAIAIPALGEPVLWPPGAIGPESLRAIGEHAAALAAGAGPPPPGLIAEHVPVLVGDKVLGVVATTSEDDSRALEPDQRPWLEAGAAAAAVIALMREADNGSREGARRALLRALRVGAPVDVAALTEHARRLGFDLSQGAVALCAAPREPDGALPDPELLARHPELLADLGSGRVCGLVALGSPRLGGDGVEPLITSLSAHGLQVALSSPRRDPATLHAALREAELLVELALSGAALAGHEETYRLLIGVLLRDRDELELLRTRTISPLAAYDAQHDSDLLATLLAFLAHHGSTTETADAMGLHRHTVGYRLSRVHEVSGLSPYESDGRERLSLGLKADQILGAERGLTRALPARSS